jgi:hypothetical protein
LVVVVVVRIRFGEPLRQPPQIFPGDAMPSAARAQTAARSRALCVGRALLDDSPVLAD